ncbi:MAG: DNA repair protein RadC [Alphaproteobacteria bacterium]|nr:DNA repair protein RadC [Alphaproteobacteria bacterium]
MTDQPDYLGHRARVIEKFMTYGATVFADYEFLELILMCAIPRIDVKPLAKQLLSMFGSLNGVLTADAKDLMKIKGIKNHTALLLKVMLATCQKVATEKIKEGPVLKDWTNLMAYCQMIYANETVEKMYILFLNHGLRLIYSEMHQKGTVDHIPVYPREILKRALDLNAASVVMMHNHPSGDANPSQNDIEATKAVRQLLETVGIQLVDHLIIGKSQNVYSFRTHGI